MFLLDVRVFTIYQKQKLIHTAESQIPENLPRHVFHGRKNIIQGLKDMKVSKRLKQSYVVLLHFHIFRPIGFKHKPLLTRSYVFCTEQKWMQENK